MRARIIILTHNRPERLRRILNYYNEYGGDYNIIVADSSSDENKKGNKKTISSLSNLNISYLSNYSPKNKLLLRYLHKIADAINYVEEEHCVLCPDDGLITPNGINQSIDFLEKNPNFTVAHGHYISFYLKTDKKEKKQFRWKLIYPYKSITFPDAKARLFFHFSNYYPTTLAVYRTDFLKMIYKETIKFTNDLRFCELLPSALTLIHGKMKHLDVFYAALEHIPTSLGSTVETLKDFIKAGTYYEKYAKFRYCLAIHLSKDFQLTIEDSKRVVDNAISVYTKKYYSKKTKKLANTMKDVLNSLPDWVNERIRTLYRKLFLSKQIRMDDFRSSADFLSKFYDDVNKIRRYTLFYSKKK